MKPLITVITPVHNRERSILRAIESVRRQEEARFEHIIVDDGSSDGTCALIEAINDPRLRLVKLPQWRGANHARNVGLDESTGEFITFLDSDDEYLPFRLGRSIELLKANPDFNLVLSSFETTRGAKRTASVNRDMRLSPLALERQLMAHTIFIAGSAITVRRKALANGGRFEADLGRLQDRDFLLRLSREQKALMDSTPDWIKHQSIDSISSRKRGYIEAYADLLGKHPQLASDYTAMTRYMAARHLLACVTRGHLGVALEDYRLCVSRPELRLSLPELLSGYVAGKTQRKQIRAEQLQFV